MRKVLITCDYEIFGNGTGDVRQHMIDPTERMARICEKHSVPLTLFVEMEETLAFQRFAPALERSLGYDPYALLRNQVADLVRRGHDAQLHLHPEWHRAGFQDGQWRLDPSRGTVDSLFHNIDDTSDYIAQRKSALEEIAGSGQHGHRIIAYRAGAFSAQPGTRLIPALVRNGFVLDSSVVHGLTRHDEGACFDYRNAPSGRHIWRVTSDVAVEDKPGTLWEVPIASRPGRRFHQITIGRLKAKFSRHVPRAQQSRLVKQLGVRKNPVGFARFLWQPVPIKFDFHNVAPRKLARWIRCVPAPSDGSPDIVVLIGHSKEHINDAAFETLLRELKQESNIRISSFTEMAALLRSPRESDATLALGRGAGGEVSNGIDSGNAGASPSTQTISSFTLK